MISPLHVFHRKNGQAEPIAIISLYDAPSAILACDAGADALLVGDSLGNVVLGFQSTVPVTLDDMAHHVAAVARGVQLSTRREVPIIADLPFGTYQIDADTTHAARLLMQAGAHALKLEGGGPHALEAAELLFDMGAPVMAHIGFTPQSSLSFHNVVQGKTVAAAQELLLQALRLQEAGAFAIVLEAMPAEVAGRITDELDIPTIGIGAGVHCSGQVLVWHDLTGQTANPPRFVKPFGNANEVLKSAAQNYVREVHDKTFPAPEHTYAMPPDELAKWQDGED